MIRPRRHLIAPACFAAAFLTVSAVSSAQSQPDPVQALWAYSGIWRVNIEHLDTAYSKASNETSTLQNECWKSGQYVACRQTVNGESKVLLVFTCANQHDCTSYQIPSDGSTSASGKLIVDGNTWTFPWSNQEHDKTTWFRVVNVWSSHNTIEFRQEFSTDQKHWTTMSTGHETRLGVPRNAVDPVTHP